MAPPLVKGRALARQRLAGVAFLVVLTLLVLLSIALYNKDFTKTVDVSLKTDRVGNQLSVHADVKLRGVLVGEVRKISAGDGTAVLRLALKPGQAGAIPRNVMAQLLPKTLFGEKEVDLVLPDQAQGHLRTGDTIEQDRSTTALETETAVDNLLPLLRSLKPQQLSTTLDALSAAVRGRGDELGTTLVTASAYLKALHPSLPGLAHDLQGLADLSGTLADAAPNLLTTLDNLSFSSRSAVQQRVALDAFLRSTADTARRTETLVSANAQRLTDLAKDSIPSLQLFATYSRSFDCLLNRVAFSETETERTFGGAQPGLALTVEAVDRFDGYGPAEVPQDKETRDSRCFGLGKKPVVPFPLYGNPQDGYKDSAPPEDPGTGPPGFSSARAAFLAAYSVAPASHSSPLPGATSPFAGLLIAPMAGSRL